MLNEKMETALNAQINMELSAFYTYLSMAAYLEGDGLTGMAAWMRHHADEEMEHAMRIYDYIHSRRGHVTLQAIAKPPNEWDSPLNAFEDAFKHEQKVTASIDALVEQARDLEDHATESFLQWFVDEQVEEEEIVDAAIQKLKLIGDDGPGLYMLDRDLGENAEHDEH
jgi:ferritin